MASIDISAAFDVVNFNVLIDKLRIIGLPDDVVGLIASWLKNGMSYIEVKRPQLLILLYQFWQKPRVYFGTNLICNLYPAPFQFN